MKIRCRDPFPTCPKIKNIKFPCPWMDDQRHQLPYADKAELIAEYLFVGSQFRASYPYRGVGRMDVDEKRRRRRSLVQVHEEIVEYRVITELLDQEYLGLCTTLTRDLIDEHANLLMARILRQVDIYEEPWNPKGEYVCEQVNQIITAYLRTLWE